MSGEAEHLKCLRLKAGKSIEEICLCSGVEISWYYDLESDDDEIESNVSFSMLKKVCDCIGVKLVDVFHENFTKPSIMPVEFSMRLRQYLTANDWTLALFEDKVGYFLPDIFERPTVMLEWNVECLKRCCELLRIDWLEVAKGLGDC